MKRMQRYENALKIAQDCGNVFFEMSIQAEIKRMQTDNELAEQEATVDDT